MSSRYLKTTVILSWFILFALLVTRDLFIPDLGNQETILLQQAKQEQFYGVWFNHVRIGYVAETLRPQDQDLLLDQEAHLLLTVLNTTQPIDMLLRARLSRNLVLKDFNFHFTSPFYNMSAQGTVSGSTISFRLDTGEATIEDSITLSAPPLLAVNDRSYLLTRLSEPGKKIRVPSFDPFSLTGRESVITYHGQEKILIRGRLKQLHNFSETVSGMRVNFWLDDAGRVVKEESPAGFQFIAEPEFRAKDIVSSGSELLRAVAIARRGPLPGPNTGRVTYRLTLPPDTDFDLNGGRQTWDSSLLTVRQENTSALTAPNTGGQCDTPANLQSSRYVQSDNEEIKAQAVSIAGNENDPAVQVRLLADWVYTYLEKRPVIGLPDALTTLKTKRGDCNEHASLFAALARSIGIPTVIATGVTLQDDAFYYHAWNEVCLSGKWYSLDTTTNQFPADLFHIRFAGGDLEQQLKIGSLLGKLQIEILPQQD